MEAVIRIRTMSSHFLMRELTAGSADRQALTTHDSSCSQNSLQFSLVGEVELASVFPCLPWLRMHFLAIGRGLWLRTLA